MRLLPAVLLLLLRAALTALFFQQLQQHRQLCWIRYTKAAIMLGKLWGGTLSVESRHFCISCIASMNNCSCSNNTVVAPHRECNLHPTPTASGALDAAAAHSQAPETRTPCRSPRLQVWIRQQWDRTGACETL